MGPVSACFFRLHPSPRSLLTDRLPNRHHYRLFWSESPSRHQIPSLQRTFIVEKRGLKSRWIKSVFGAVRYRPRGRIQRIPGQLSGSKQATEALPRTVCGQTRDPCRVPLHYVGQPGWRGAVIFACRVAKAPLSKTTNPAQEAQGSRETATDFVSFGP